MFNYFLDFQGLGLPAPSYGEYYENKKLKLLYERLTEMISNKDTFPQTQESLESIYKEIVEYEKKIDSNFQPLENISNPTPEVTKQMTIRQA